MGKYLQGDLPRGYKDGGESNSPRTFFASTEEIQGSKRLRYERGKHFLGVIDAEMKERELPNGAIDRFCVGEGGRDSRRGPPCSHRRLQGWKITRLHSAASISQRLSRQLHRRGSKGGSRNRHLAGPRGARPAMLYPRPVQGGAGRAGIDAPGLQSSGGTVG